MACALRDEWPVRLRTLFEKRRYRLHSCGGIHTVFLLNESFRSATIPGLSRRQATISAVLTKNAKCLFPSQPGLITEIQDEEERWQLWLACQTEEEIAKAVGMTQQGVGRVSQQNESFRFVVKPGLFAEIQDEAAKT